MSRWFTGCLFLLALSPAIAGATLAPATATEPVVPAGAVPAPDAAPAAADMRAVMAGRDFSQRETRHELRLRKAVRDWLKPDQDPKESKAPAASGFWQTLIQTVSWLIGHALWLGALLVVALAFLTRRRWLPLLPRRSPAMPVAAQVTAIVADEAEAPLPDDLLNRARSLWLAGQARAALSLLYRGASRSLQLPDPNTESENLALVRQYQTPEVITGYEQITRAWRDAAWRQCPPEDITTLLAAYERCFQRGEQR